MKVLRGSGSTFSTSGKHWRPFPGSSYAGRKVARRNAKLRKLMQAGTIKPLSKDEARALTQHLAKP